MARRAQKGHPNGCRCVGCSEVNGKEQASRLFSGISEADHDRVQEARESARRSAERSAAEFFRNRRNRWW